VMRQVIQHLLDVRCVMSRIVFYRCCLHKCVSFFVCFLRAPLGRPPWRVKLQENGISALCFHFAIVGRADRCIARSAAAF
jgi:hypothetical protein